MYDIETQAKVAVWRRKAIDGTLTPEDQVEAIKYLAAGRRSAYEATTTAKGTRKATAKAAANVPSGDDLLSEMMRK